MGAKRRVLFGVLAALMAIMTSACAISQTPPVIRLALLAPFEGRYREVGYDLLYAMRLALADGGYAHVELLPIDDGGDASTARDHAAAVAANPQVKLVIAAGAAATDPDTLNALGSLPVIVLGHWGDLPPQVTRFSLTPADHPLPYADILTWASHPAPLEGGEVLALKQFAQLRDDLSGITVYSSSQPPDSAFTARYLGSDLFVPEPGILVTLGYDAAHLAAQVVTATPNITRAQVLEGLKTQTYNGINGTIRFDADGYWENAPQHAYHYNAQRQLIPHNADD